ncbi:MAG: hypothetical protein A2X05_17540 [Bacteroidetes bacterium GWE2_41_25]|nr:MAG: hypothetical protein A2X03_14905 [Bacteroidetes bacterium GWA2_40_15]OFX94514.1 MAG: hypothetical protein A2X06_15340 [Bacteroidetes bacterium GWC2_40_22]OFX96563.1 MAG: hypothetical protein A2X05_17540 [Bacteroidetes bacterium GWE2_41_25]OFY59440.1 MAG: hypothetical protein A2X04_06470 [Bacteroidetes bacterium GWF2_41_9]HBH83977.1 hypothetical protein [Bacteroidales bacterium]
MKKILFAGILLVTITIASGQDKFTDKRDGTVYRTVTINGTTWMAENLRYMPKQGSVYYDNDSNNARVYGVLYEWKAAVKVCPSDWHLPSGTEFRDLSDHFQHHDSWRNSSPGYPSIEIQLGGMQDHEGTFSEIDESGYYWTSTDYDKNSAEYFSYLIIDKMPVTDISRKADIDDIEGTAKSDKYSVRCVKN